MIENCYYNFTKVKKYEIWCRLFGLLLLIGINLSEAFDADCDFKQILEPGKTYYITNPAYPNAYRGAKACRWHAQSDAKIRLTCNVFDIPYSQDCALDTFNVYTDPSKGPRRYCGRGNFTIESPGNEMIITLTTVYDTPGGRFRCNLQSIPDQNECSCGWKKPTKIYGGEETGVNEYPMMAGIVDAANQIVFCGGTIISERHIVTAAHCLINKSPNQLGVLVGDHDLTTGSDTSAAKLIRVERYLIHPSYTVQQRDYDIAIVYINTPLTFSNEVGPACLPFHHYLDSFSGSYVDVLGWGLTDFAGPPSDTLQKITVRVTNWGECKSIYPELQYRQMCTFAEGKDACSLDSGGPVLWQDPSTRRVTLVGIVSYGPSCSIGRPAVNTRVGAFLDFIISATPGVNYCRAE